MSFLRTSSSGISKLSLFVLMLVFYSKSRFLTMTFLSLYGLIHGVACVPGSRVSAVKSLLRYGVDVLQHGLGSSIPADFWDSSPCEPRSFTIKPLLISLFFIGGGFEPRPRWRCHPRFPFFYGWFAILKSLGLERNDVRHRCSAVCLGTSILRYVIP